MTPQQFDRLAARTRLRDRARRMARAVLVDGLSKSAAARLEGVTPEAARQAADRILLELRREGGYPPDWQVVTVVVPAELAQDIRDRARHAAYAAGIALA